MPTCRRTAALRFSSFFYWGLYCWPPEGFGYWRSTVNRLPQGLSVGNGRLEATEVQIASKTPGRLAEVLVDEGDKVTQGQLLARMDTRTLEAQRNQAEAEVIRARENLSRPRPM